MYHIGPYNTSYKDLYMHLELAELSLLLKPQYRKSSNIGVHNPNIDLEDSESDLYTADLTAGGGGLVEPSADMWCVVWDVAHSIDQQFLNNRPISPTGETSALVSLALSHSYGLYRPQGQIFMASPSESIAAILPTDKFRFVSVPEQSQCQAIEVSSVFFSWIFYCTVYTLFYPSLLCSLTIVLSD